MVPKIPNPPVGNLQPFRAEQPPLEAFVSAVSAQQATGSDDSVTGNAGGPAALHDVADRSGGPGPTRGSGDIAVGRDLPGGMRRTTDSTLAVNESGIASEQKSDSGRDLRAAGVD